MSLFITSDDEAAINTDIDMRVCDNYTNAGPIRIHKYYKTITTNISYLTEDMHDTVRMTVIARRKYDKVPFLRNFELILIVSGMVDAATEITF